MARRKKTPEELASERAEDEARWRRMRERIAYNEARIAKERAAEQRRRRVIRRLLPFLPEGPA